MNIHAPLYHRVIDLGPYDNPVYFMIFAFKTIN